MKIRYVSQEIGTLTARSGMLPLHNYVESSWIQHGHRSEQWQAKSWTLGHAIEVFSNRYYGSAWNCLVPLVDEWNLLRQMGGDSDILHFLWGEFATPSMFALFRRKATKIVGTFHCSQRRQWRVTKRPKWYLEYDHIVLMSETQRDYFIDNGYSSAQLSVISHGVDTEWFAYRQECSDHQVLNLLLVGSTERDHKFAIRVLNEVGNDVRVRVATNKCYHHYYQNCINVELLERVSDDELRTLYQEADILFMPMLDCTANNAILEAMSCGTPVMVNCVGGVPEYVDPKCNFVMIGKKVHEWVDMLKMLATRPDELKRRRPLVRAWGERFDWRIIAEQYMDLYERVLGS